MVPLQDYFFQPLYPFKGTNISPIIKSMKIFLFLILMVHIQPGSLLKLHASSSLQDKQRQPNESTKTNKAMFVWKDPHGKEKALALSVPTSLFWASTTAATHYKETARFVENKEKSGRKTNSLSAEDSFIIQDDPNESGREGKRLGDNNDRDDGRQAFIKKTKTTTKASTFAQTRTTAAARSKEIRSPGRVRNSRSLKNDSDGGMKKVSRADESGIGNEKNYYDKHHGLVLREEKKNVKKRGNFQEQPEAAARKEAEAIESFQKTFANGNDVSVSEAVAFAGMDMGILEKFEKRGKSLGGKEEAKSGDKKSIQGDKQLSPSELGDGNNDIKMQHFQHITPPSIGNDFQNNIGGVVGGEQQLNENVDAAANSAVSSVHDGKKTNKAKEAESDEMEAGNEEVVPVREMKGNGGGGGSGAEDDDDHGAGGTREVEFDKSVEGAPEGIDSIENVSSFYNHYYTRNNDKNNLQESRNQSSRLTFASSADFDKAGSGKSGGSGVGPDFVESAAASAASTASADEVKLYRLVQRLLKESPLIDG